MNNEWLSWCVCAPLCVAVVAAQAQALADRAATAAVPQPASSAAPLVGLDRTPESNPARRAMPLQVWQGGGAADESLPLVSVITLPPEPRPGRPPGRSHHALSLRSESSTQALRSMGFEVTDCSTRFRLPSRLRQSSANVDGGFEATAQVSWLCRF